MMMGFVPAWALGDAGELARLPVLAGIESLTVAVDNDESRRGQQGCRRMRGSMARCQTRGVARHPKPSWRRFQRSCNGEDDFGLINGTSR
jgi:hypothetical protein